MIGYNTTKELDGGGKKSVLDAQIFFKDRAKPPARRGCGAYASESDTTNLQSSIVNIQSRLVRVGFKKTVNGKITKFSNALKY